MRKGKKAEPDDKVQSARFIKVAGQIQADKPNEAFEKVVYKIIKKKR